MIEQALFVSLLFAGDIAMINGIIDRGGYRGQHAFELYGNFEGFARIRSEVRCNGALVESKVDYASLNQINVFIAEPRGGSLCTFTLQRLDDGVRSFAFGPVQPISPEIEILGLNDRGNTGSRHYVELYGRFPTFWQLEPRVLCRGITIPAIVDYASYPQVNISFPYLASASDCTYALRRKSDGRESPVFGAAPSRTSDVLTGFGAYAWGGLAAGSGETLSRSQQYLTGAGFDVARVVITPVVRSGNPADNYYQVDLAGLNAACPIGQDYLACAVRTPAYQAAISDPRIRTIILTAYGSSSVGPSGGQALFIDYDYLSDPINAEAVRREYRDLTYALYETQRGTGKTFVIANWESDNSIYCGSAYGYATDPSFRDACDHDRTRYPIPPSTALAGIELWFRLRQQGIQQGQFLAWLDGYFSGVTVGDGIEFNSIRFLQEQNIDCTLEDIIFDVRPRFASYSSYDSQGEGTMDADLASLKQRLGSTELLVGEVGYPEHAIDAIDAFRTVETAKAVQRARLRAAVLWEGFDTSAADHRNPFGRVQPFGVLGVDGADRLVMTQLRAELAAQAQEMAFAPVQEIRGIVDRGLTTASGRTFRYFELYGVFGSTPNTTTVICDGFDARAETTYPGSTQINVRIPHDWRDRYCVFRVARSDGSARSLSFGPKLARAN